MKTILLTGFSTFGKYPANSTELVARRLHDQEFKDYRFESKILETAIFHTDIGEELTREASLMSASGIICLGMTSTAKGFRIETTAHNKIDSPYCPAEINGSRIDCTDRLDQPLSCGLDGWDTSEFMDKCRSDGLHAEYSKDPGRFCCNQLMYLMVKAQEDLPKSMRIPWIFIHIPCSPQCIPKSTADFTASGKITYSLEQIERGIRHLVTYLG